MFIIKYEVKIDWLYISVVAQINKCDSDGVVKILIKTHLYPDTESILKGHCKPLNSRPYVWALAAHTASSAC